MKKIIPPVDPLWYSPMYTIAEFHGLKSDQMTKQFRKAQEMYFTAVFAMGLRDMLKREFFVQLVDDTEGSPDVMLLTRSLEGEGEPNSDIISKIEVITYTTNSSETIAEFLTKKKLNLGNYDDTTTILCCIDRADGVIPSVLDIRDGLQNTKSNIPVVLLQQTTAVGDQFRIAELNPNRSVMNHNFNLNDSLSTPLPPCTIKRKRSSRPIMEWNPREKHTPFEKLGL